MSRIYINPDSTSILENPQPAPQPAPGEKPSNAGITNESDLVGDLDEGIEEDDYDDYDDYDDDEDDDYDDDEDELYPQTDW